jgi:hypothetical protein
MEERRSVASLCSASFPGSCLPGVARCFEPNSPYCPLVVYALTNDDQGSVDKHCTPAKAEDRVRSTVVIIDEFIRRCRGDVQRVTAGTISALPRGHSGFEKSEQLTPPERQRHSQIHSSRALELYTRCRADDSSPDMTTAMRREGHRRFGLEKNNLESAILSAS